MVKVVLALVLLAHGIGHSMGLLGVFNVTRVNPAWDGDSWLLSGFAGTAVTHAAGVVLWVAAMVGFAALAAVVMGWLPEAWFQPLAVGSAVASLAGVVLFPVAFPTFSTVGALVVDLVVLAAATWLHWLPSDLAS